MVSLHIETIGSGPRIVLVHGFTQNGRCWEPLASSLAVSHEVVLVDAPGHGLSEHDDADLFEAGQLILEAGSGGPSGEPIPATYVGYSMGARMLLHAALNMGPLASEPGSESDAVSAAGSSADSAPDSVVSPGDGSPGDGLIKRLILIGATAGLESDDERIARREADESLACSLELDGLGPFLDRWLAMPMFAGLSTEAAAYHERLSNRVDGLAASLRRCGTGTQQPLWYALAGLGMPVSVVVGVGDQKFGLLASRLASAIGSNATKIEIPGGHAVHLESPELLLPILTS